MTREEFEKAYEEGGGMTIEELRSWGLVTIPCNCGEEGCEGWRMEHVMMLKAEELNEVYTT